MKTFQIWEPEIGDIDGNILHRFVRHQNALKSLITSAQELVKQKVVISSRANKFIVYKLETAFDIIVTHDKRLLKQAKQVLLLLNGKIN